MFLGPSLAMAIVYVWGRRNPSMRMNLLGFFNFNAPFLPWVLVGIESLLGQVLNWMLSFILISRKFSGSILLASSSVMCITF